MYLYTLDDMGSLQGELHTTNFRVYPVKWYVISKLQGDLHSID